MLRSLMFLRGADTPRYVPQLWGDPFADDGWREIVRVSDWDSVDVDELFRFMPGLTRATAGPRPRPIRSAFEHRLADAGLPLKAHGGLGRGIDRGCVSDQKEAVTLLQGLAYLPIERTPCFSDRDATRVAVLSGVHPAFVWPEALLSHDRYAAFAWLGCLERARRALLPLEVAEYLVDTLERDGKHLIVKDPTMDQLLRSRIVACALLRAAVRRLSKAAVVFDLDSLAIRTVSTFCFWS